jgi:hypothetical protein
MRIDYGNIFISFNIFLPKSIIYYYIKIDFYNNWSIMIIKGGFEDENKNRTRSNKN